MPWPLLHIEFSLVLPIFHLSLYLNIIESVGVGMAVLISDAHTTKTGSGREEDGEANLELK